MAEKLLEPEPDTEQRPFVVSVRSPFSDASFECNAVTLGRFTVVRLPEDVVVTWLWR